MGTTVNVHVCMYVPELNVAIPISFIGCAGCGNVQDHRSRQPRNFTTSRSECYFLIFGVAKKFTGKIKGG